MNILWISGIIKINLKEKSLRPLVIIAVFNPAIYFIGETFGISNTTASESGIFLACIPVASLVASTLILNKKPSGWQVTGIFITLIGVVMTVLAVGISSSLSITGYGFLGMAVLFYALYSVYVDKAANYTGIEITYIMLVVGAVIFMMLAFVTSIAKGNTYELITLPVTDKWFCISVVYQGIGCSVIAFILANLAIAKIGVNRTSSFIGVSTVVSVAAGALILKEQLTAVQIAGAAVIILGVYVANSRKSSLRS